MSVLEFCLFQVYNVTQGRCRCRSSSTFQQTLKVGVRSRGTNFAAQTSVPGPRHAVPRGAGAERPCADHDAHPRPRRRCSPGSFKK